MRLIDADNFKKRLDNMEYVYLQDSYQDVIDAIDCEVTYFKEEHPEQTPGVWRVGSALIACDICNITLLRPGKLYRFCPNCGRYMKGDTQ